MTPPISQTETTVEHATTCGGSFTVWNPPISQTETTVEHSSTAPSS